MAEWLQACGYATDIAAARALQVNRHTIANWRGRELTKLECLALAAVYHRLEPFDRSQESA